MNSIGPVNQNPPQHPEKPICRPTSLPLRLLWLMVASLELTGCAPPRPQGPSVGIYLSSDFFADRSQSANRSGKRLQMPDGVNGFRCFLLNVMGEGILGNLSSQTEVSQYLTHLAGGGFCSYRGVVSSPITQSDVTVRVEIPRGRTRVIQLLGVSDPAGSYCSGQSTDATQIALYELARTTVDVFADQTIALDSNYNSLSDPEKKRRYTQCSTGFSPSSLTYPDALPTPPVAIAVSPYCTDKMALAPFAGGSGSATDPYLICSPTQFNYIGANASSQTALLSAHYLLMSDLHFGGMTFEPIGSPNLSLTTTTHFSGVFDGNGYILSNINLTQTSASTCTGVFTGLTSGAQVKNLHIYDTSFTNTGSAGTAIGTLAGCVNSAEVTRVAAKVGTITGNGKVGGLIGSVDIPNGSTSGVTLSEVYARMTVTNGGTGSAFAGGMIGELSNSSAQSLVVKNAQVAVPAIGGSNAKCGGLIGSYLIASGASCSLSQILIGGLSNSINCATNGLATGHHNLNGTQTHEKIRALDALRTGTHLNGSIDLAGFGTASSTQITTASTYNTWDATTWRVNDGFVPQLFNLPITP